jgi:hypothetical protein
MSGIDESGPFKIDPDGPGLGEPAFEAYCNLTGNFGTYVCGDVVK